MAVYLKGRGASSRELSCALSWREFEAFTGAALEACEFEVRKNFHLKSPRRELDVIGIKNGFGIAFDCKHWRRDSPGRLAEAALKQRERAELLLKSEGIPQLREVLPALVILSRVDFTSTSEVPVVPVDGLQEFILGARGLEGTKMVLKGRYHVQKGF
jgi:hypothetical protein